MSTIFQQSRQKKPPFPWWVMGPRHCMLQALCILVGYKQRVEKNELWTYSHWTWVHWCVFPCRNFLLAWIQNSDRSWCHFTGINLRQLKMIGLLYSASVKIIGRVTPINLMQVLAFRPEEPLKGDAVLLALLGCPLTRSWSYKSLVEGSPGSACILNTWPGR